jgi:hypothetical protein
MVWKIFSRIMGVPISWNGARSTKGPFTLVHVTSSLDLDKFKFLDDILGSLDDDTMHNHFLFLMFLFVFVPAFSQWI